MAPRRKGARDILAVLVVGAVLAPCVAAPASGAAIWCLPQLGLQPSPEDANNPDATPTIATDFAGCPQQPSMLAPVCYTLPTADTDGAIARLQIIPALLTSCGGTDEPVPAPALLGGCVPRSVHTPDRRAGRGSLSLS